MNKKAKLLVFFLIVISLSYLSILVNHKTLLYKSIDITVKVKSGNANSIKFLETVGNTDKDFTVNFIKEEKPDNSMLFYTKKVPVKNLKIVSSDKATVIAQVDLTVEKSKLTRTLTDNFYIDHVNNYAPVPASNGAYNYRGNLFFLEIFLLRLIVFSLALWLLVFISKRYFFNYYILLYLPILITKLYFASKLDILDAADFPFILIAAFFSEAAFWFIINLLLYFRSRYRSVVVLVTTLIVLYITNFIANIVHFFYTNENLRIDNLRFFDVTSIGAVTSYGIVIYAIVIIIPLIAYFIITIRQRGQEFIRKNRTIEVVGLGLLMFAVGAHIYSPERIVKDGSSVLDSYVTRRNNLEILTPSVVSAIQEIYKTVIPASQDQIAISQQDKILLTQLGILGQNKIHNSKKINKIIFIPIESLSSQLLHYYNKSIPANVTAEFDSLLSQYPHIDNFYTTREPTLYGMLAALSSNIDMNKAVNPSYMSLPKILGQHGFDTIFIQGMSKTWANYSFYFDKFGFKKQLCKEYFAKKYPGSNEDFGWGFTDNVMFNEVIDQLKLAKSEQKLFLSLLTIDTHMPGGRVEPGLDINPISNVTNPLLISLYSTDRSLKNFMDKLEQENLMKEDTLIILSADHSSPLHANYIKLDGIDRQRLLNKIPLIFITKNKEVLASLTKINQTYSSQLDIAPTILGILGIKPSVGMLGKDLLSDQATFAMTYHDESLEYISYKDSYIINAKADYKNGTKEAAIHDWLLNLLN